MHSRHVASLPKLGILAALMPGGRGRGAAKQPAADEAGAPAPKRARRNSGGGSGSGPGADANMQGPYNLELCALRATVLKRISENPILGDVAEQNPLAITANGAPELCGREEPFNMTKYNAAMKAHGEYKCGANLFWLQHTDQTRVPRNQTQIARLQEHHFAKPSPMPLDIVVGVKNGEDPLANKGRLVRLSPSEIVDAFLLAVDRDINIGDEDVLKKWRTHMLSTTFVFKLAESDDDRHFAAIQLRENLGANYAAMRTPAR